MMAKGLFDLDGKVTVITGGNSGLGLGFGRGIAKQGGSVAIWARSAEKNAKAKAELESFGVKVTTQQVDVSSEAEVVAAFEQVMAEFGRIDCVIANSGVPSRNNSVLTMTAEDWHGLLDINMHGAFYTLREGAKHMVKRAEAGDPGGSLVFCSSLAMFQGLVGKGNYAAAKAGIGAMIRCMAVELGKYGIRANSVAPGYVKTEMTGTNAEWTPIDKHFASKTPIPRPGFPADFEGIAAYLASDASSWHSGDTIVIDGAYLIQI
jgi:NAD(P)-dependent dehydrogenase (short-subunit alcohol dehydrogenase family)